MKASLIFSSTSHSINVQKVRIAGGEEYSPLIATDLQNCVVKSLRLEVHDT
jgi:molybdenum cofactor biosynthesis enzyme MoaA